MTVRYWWNRFGPLFAGERVEGTRDAALAEWRDQHVAGSKGKAEVPETGSHLSCRFIASVLRHDLLETSLPAPLLKRRPRLTDALALADKMAQCVWAMQI